MRIHILQGATCGGWVIDVKRGFGIWGGPRRRDTGHPSYLMDFSFQSLNSVRRVESIGKPEAILLRMQASLSKYS